MTPATVGSIDGDNAKLMVAYLEYNNSKVCRKNIPNTLTYYLNIEGMIMFPVQEMSFSIYIRSHNGHMRTIYQTHDARETI